MAVKLTGPQKAAILLMSLGEEVTAQVLKGLNAEEIKQLGASMCTIQEIKKETAAELIQEFTQSFTQEGDIYASGDHFFRNLLPRVLDADQVDDVMHKIEKEQEEIPFKNVRDVDAKVLAGFIKNEHPQTIAIILVHLDPEKAGQVIGLLPEALQLEVMNRIAHLETVPPDLIREVDEVLEHELLSVEGGSSRMLGGVRTAAEILNNCDKRTEGNILQGMEEADAELAEKIRKLMFVFEDLVSVTDQGIRELLKEIKPEELTLALKTASDDLKAKIFGNLSKRAAQILEEDLSILGPVRLSDVEAAQQNIITIARRMEKEGRIVLMSGEGGDTFV